MSAITSKFTLFKRGNPCPLCDSNDGRCKENGDGLILCMTLTDAVDVPGKKFVGLDSSHTWGMWADEADRSDTQQQWRAELDRKREQRRQAELERKASAMPAVVRDRYNRLLLDCLSLRPEDRADLHRRGFTDEQIQQGGFKSVEPWQRLNRRLPTTLPGVNLDGRSLNVPYAGYLCPIRDVDGLIVGFQVRTRDPLQLSETIRIRDCQSGELAQTREPQPDQPKYYWLTSATKKRPNGPTPHLNGELPLSVFRPPTVTRRAIALVEGTGPKPLKTSEQFGVITIGAAGGQFASSPETLKATLSAIATELGTKQIDFYPDAGAVQNPNVMRQYRAVWQLLKLWGYEIRIGWWGQTTKDHPDVDELAATAQVEWISTAQLESIAHKLNGGVPPVQPAIAPTRKSDAGDRYRQEAEKIQRQLNTLSAVPTITAKGRYIPKGLLPLPVGRPGIVLIDAFMGSGKTVNTLKDLVEEHRRLYPDSQRISFVPRNMLGFQSAEVLRIPHHTQIKGSLKGITDITQCFESIWKIDLQAIKPYSLIFADEASQSFKQILDGNTCKDSQAFILDAIRSLFRIVIERGGWVVLSEDGLTNCELDFVKDASGGDVVEFLKFEREGTAQREYTLFSRATDLWERITARASRNQPMLMASDSAKELRSIERKLISIGVAAERIFILDKDSSEEPWAKALVRSPQDWLYENEPLFLGYSPTLSSGVSITDPDGYYKDQLIYFTHLDPREAKQIPDRLRSDVPRLGYVKTSGIADDELLSRSRPDVVRRDLLRNQDGVVKLSKFAEYAAQKSSDLDEPDLLEVMAQVKADKDDPSTPYGFYLKHYSQYYSRDIYNRANLRDNYIAILESQGHKVKLIDSAANKALSEERQAIKETLDRELGRAIATSEVGAMTPDDARAILANLESKREDRLRANKCLLEDKLPGVRMDDPEFVYKIHVENRGAFTKAAELLFWRKNPDIAKHLDRWGLFHQASNAAKTGQIIILHRIPKRSPQAQLMADAPLEPFINGDITQWCNDTPEAQKLHDWVALRSRQFQRYFRLTIKPRKPEGEPQLEDDRKRYHTPVDVVNKLLRKLGFETECEKRKGGRGNQIRYWRISNLNDLDRDRILEALERKYLKDCERKGEQPQIPVVTTRSIDNQKRVVTTPQNQELLIPANVPPDIKADLLAMWADAPDPEHKAVVLQCLDDVKRMYCPLEVA